MAMNIEESSKLKRQDYLSPSELCQAGQETVQEIVLRACEISQSLKVATIPTSSPQGLRMTQDRVNKLKDLISKMENSFKKLRVIYAEYQKHAVVVDADQTIQELIPLLNSSDGVEVEKPPKSGREQMLLSRKQDLEALLQMKNQQIETLMTLMRTLTWDLNSVLSCIL